MKPSRRRWCWLAVALVGCGGGHASAPGGATGPMSLGDAASPAGDLGARPPFAAPGERMSYRLSVYKVEVGVFGIAVGEPVDVAGRRAIAIQAGVQSTGIAALFKKVRTDFASWVDVQTGRPVLSRVVETAGADDPSIEISEARFHAAREGTLPIAMTAADGTQTVEDQVVVGDQIWDVPSILLYLRGWDGEVGAEMAAQVVRSRYVWRGQFRIAARESRVTELGQLPTVRIDGVARRILRNGSWEPQGDVRELSVWITDDADRVPVLVVGHTDFGDVRMEIVGYAAGHEANLRGAGVAGARP